MENPKIFICVPAYGQQVTTPCLNSLMGLGQVLFANKISYYFGTHSFPDIAESRNMFSTIWYDKIDAEFLLFMDADMAVDPEQILAMYKFNQPLVGVVYPQKTLPIKFVVKTLPPHEVERDGNFQTISGLGCGAMLIRKDCFAKLLEEYPYLIEDSLENHAGRDMLQQYGIGRLLCFFDKINRKSEDISFCERVREAGMKVWASIGYDVGHFGSYLFKGRF